MRKRGGRKKMPNTAKALVNPSNVYYFNVGKKKIGNIRNNKNKRLSFGEMSKKARQETLDMLRDE